jgi:hypothetical protein
MPPQSPAARGALSCEAWETLAARFEGARGRPVPVPETLDEAYCRRVADRYDRQPPAAPDTRTRELYERFRLETRAQFDLVREAGIDVVPFGGDGPPYASSQELLDDVRSGTVKVTLTSAHHGPHPPGIDHPLRAPAGVQAHGIELTYNDLFRVVHDVFGHVLGGTGFGPRGEFAAAFSHMLLCSEQVRPVVFVEQIGQICWFFYGAHLRDERGRLPARGEAGYVPPRHRPYPEQKVFLYEPEFLRSFEHLFVSTEVS